MPAPVQSEILERYDIENVHYNLLYAFDAYINILLCFLTGLLINDKLLGLRRSILLFVGLILVGNLLLTVSAYYGNFTMALTSRILMGIGVECQNVTFYALIALWFTHKEHGFASSASAMVMRMGMVASGYFTPLL